MRGRASFPSMWDDSMAQIVPGTLPNTVYQQHGMPLLPPWAAAALVSIFKDYISGRSIYC